MSSSIIQYIVVRGDLNWPIGALIAQGAHASVAAIIKFYAKESTQSYINSLDTMHKVVLKAESEDQMKRLIESLEADDIKHYVWVEQPESIVSCLATAPHDKSILQPFFKKFKLFN